MFAAHGIAKQLWPGVSASPGKAFSQLTPNFAEDGRIVCEMAPTGVTNRGVVLSGQHGIAVWDFNHGTNYYEMSGFAVYPDYWGYAVNSGSAGMANRNNWFVFDGGVGPSSSDAKGYVARVDIGTAPSVDISFVYASSYRYNQPCNYPVFFSNVAGDGYTAAVVGYCASWLIQSPQSGDGWLSKATNTGVFGQTSTPLRTGLPTDGSYQGQPAVAFSPCGGTAPNRYAITAAEGPDYRNTVNLALSRIGTNPIQARVATLTYAGFQTPGAIVPLDATRFINFSVYYDSTPSKATIVYTNSPTSPSTLSAGASCTVPTWPGGLGFTSDDVRSSLFHGGVYASNVWFGTGNALGIARYRLKSTSAFANGDPNVEVMVPCRFDTSGTSSITCTLLTHDINGKEMPHFVNRSAASWPTYAIVIAGAPGGKATLFYNESPSVYKIHQRTVQL